MAKMTVHAVAVMIVLAAIFFAFLNYTVRDMNKKVDVAKIATEAREQKLMRECKLVEKNFPARNSYYNKYDCGQFSEWIMQYQD